MARFELTASAGADQCFLPFLATFIRYSDRWWAYNDDSGFYMPSGLSGVDDRVDVTVSGFVPVRGSGGLVDIQRGLITGLTMAEPGETGGFEVTGLSIRAADLFDARALPDADRIFALIFGANDTFIGTGVRDTILAGGGRDQVSGFAGADTLRGGDGNDTLIGGTGRDELRGGGSADRFVFNAPAAAGNADTIVDFAPGVDRIWLQNGVLGGLGAEGDLRAAQFRVGTAATDGTDRIIHDRATGRIWLDTDGEGGRAKVLLAEVADGLRLTLDDFLII
jgi:Ca2+-binding RTX toxin-like protein